MTAALAFAGVAGVGTWTYDLRSDLFVCDAAIAALYGLDAAEAAAGIGRRAFLAHVHADDRPRFDATMARGLRRAGDSELEYRIRHPDGSIRWVLSRGHTLLDADGRPSHITGIGIETTRQRHVDAHHRPSPKLDVVGQLTGGIAHDFNNLLTVFRSSIDLLKQPDLPADRRARYIDALCKTTTRASKLTGQLLAFARRQSQKPEVFDVVAGVRALSETLHTLMGPDIEIGVSLPDGPLLVSGDASQFDTALVNLAINARDAMAGKGRLAIAVEGCATVPAMRGEPRLSGDFVAVAVSDTGAGIPMVDLDRIFEPFFTTKAVGKGTGLGLAQVFGFVHQAAGRIGVLSAPAGGAAFTLYLPRACRGQIDAGCEEEERPARDGDGACVLVVEDNAEVGFLATQMLAELGYRPLLVTDAPAAMAELAREAGRFDVVFLDVVLPGMSGIDLAGEIGRRHPGLPVVMTSGDSDVMVQDAGAGFDLLPKPYSIVQLARGIRRAIH